MAVITRKDIRGKHRKVKLQAVTDMANLEQAVHDARRGKNRNKGVLIYDRSPKENLARLQSDLANMEYHTSEGHDCWRRCPCGKTRKLHKLPFYPDHIAHHALMQVLMPHLIKALYQESGASVKGRGIHFTAKRTARWIDEHKSAGRIYYCKMDFVKFYESVDQQRIYDALCRMFHNDGIRYMLREVITSCEKGLGIGLYPIQTLTNFYMSRLCREVCGKYKVNVEIYCDDVVILGTDKKEVWRAVNYVKCYADRIMNQALHTGYSVQIIDERHALDFVGYQFFFGHTLLRKRNKVKFRRKMRTLTDSLKRYQVATSYKGWLIHCNGFNLWKSVMNMKSFKDLHVPKSEKVDADGKRMLEGSRVRMSQIAGRDLIFQDAEFGVRSKLSDTTKATVVQVEDNGITYKFFTNNSQLAETLKYCKDNDYFPFRGTLVSKGNPGKPDYTIE